MTLTPEGGAAIPVSVTTTRKVQGGAAIPVYGYMTAPTDGRPAMGGSAIPVRVLTAADLKQNGGQWTLEGRPHAMPVYTAPAGAQVMGGPALAVYPVNAWPTVPVVPVVPWYLSGGVSASACVAAYQPKGAASYAASKVNLANPGTNDAADGSTAPTWDTYNGWKTYTSGQYLTTGINPAAGWSMIVQFSAVTFNAAINYLCGVVSGGVFFGISPGNLSASVYYVVPAAQALKGSAALRQGNLAIADKFGYRNGVLDATGVATSGNGTHGIYICARNENNVANCNTPASIQALAIYNTTLTAPQIAAVRAAMATSFGSLRQVVAFGDSITGGTGASDAAHQWVNLTLASKGWGLLNNAGVAGSILQNTVQNTVAVIGGAANNNGRDRYTTGVTAYGPSDVWILFGVNDMLLNDAAFSDALFQNDLGEIVDGIVAAGTPAGQIVIGSTPYIKAAGYTQNGPIWGAGTPAKHAAYVAACAAVASAKSTKYIDVYAWMAANGGDSLIGADNIHPNDAGHQQIANAFLSVL